MNARVRPDLSPPPYYFGCWGRVGHFYFDGDGRSQGITAADLRLPWERVDGQLTPGLRSDRGRLSYEAMAPAQQGKAAIHHKDGWTALAIHDFTVDSRPNSNSVFLFKDALDFQGIVLAAREAFPKIMRRIEGAGPIILMEGTE